MAHDTLDTGYMTVAETYGLLTKALTEQALSAITYARGAYTFEPFT
jgi:hypothetical protein